MNYKLEELSAIEIGSLVRNKEITALEVINYFIDRITLRNASINAFTYTKFEEARSEAIKLDKRIANREKVGLLAGVPFALKDFLPNKKGWESSHGGVKSMIAIDEIDSEFTKAMEKEDAIAIGKTNAPMFGFNVLCENKLYGVTSTPFMVGRNSGGSSGGSASAVADGLVPIAEGTDGGGSIRIPACYCSLVGLKPSVGLVPSVCRPDAWAATHPYCFDGCLTKTVDDTALMLTLMKRFDPLDPLSVDYKDINYLKEVNKGVKGFKIAITRGFDLFPCEKEISDKVFETAYKLKAEGAIVEEVKFNFKNTCEEIIDQWCKGISFDSTIELSILKEQGLDLIKDHRDELSEEFVQYFEKVSKSTIFDVYKFNCVRTNIIDALEEVFNDYDIIISPTCGAFPPVNGKNCDTKVPDYINDMKVNLFGHVHTMLTNFSGHPSCAVPCGLSKENLPIGLQVSGKRFKDDEVLRVAKTLEKINPWNDYYQLPLNRKQG